MTKSPDNEDTEREALVHQGIGRFLQSAGPWWPPFTFLRSRANGSLISSSFTVFLRQQEASFRSFTQSLGNYGRMLHSFIQSRELWPSSVGRSRSQNLCPLMTKNIEDDLPKKPVSNAPRVAMDGSSLLR